MPAVRHPFTLSPCHPLILLFPFPRPLSHAIILLTAGLPADRH